MSDINNLSKLDNFKIQHIQEIIKERFEKDIIYTNCGRILISLNPFKNIPIYGTHYLEKYHDSFEYENVPPHVYQLAENAYQNMLEEDKHQSILISGESGAGKTEICKHIIKKILYGRNQKDSNLEKKINMSNHILESFGNAETVLNSNSSRFGKLTEIFFDTHGKVKRAFFTEYLLEKSRLIKQNRYESNFHIFYTLLGEDLSKYKITKQADYRIFLYPHEHTQPTTYKDIIDILKDLDFSEEDIENMQKSLAAILHLTSINFEEKNGKNNITTKDAVANAAELMGLKLNDLRNVLLEKKLITPDEIVNTIKSQKQAEEERDAFAKSLYSRLFAWVVAKMNSTLSSDKMGDKQNSISILDMSGFESLEKNSFEQFVINFTNEKLQSYLEKHIFTLEMELYQEEEVQLYFKNDTYRNNEGIVSMFEKSPSLLSIIDEETHFPEANNDTLFTKLNKSFEKCKYYEKKDANGFFTIRHFAGKVTYAIDSFLLKNRDEMCDDLINCAKESKDEFFSRLFKAETDLTGSIVGQITLGNYKKRSQTINPKDYNVKFNNPSRRTSLPNRTGEKRTKTIISYMKNSLHLLVQKLNVSELHFVRCIRPNALKKNNVFETTLVEKQLRYTGIADVAEICKTGYPYRKKYTEFIDTYTVFSKNSKSATEKEIVIEMLEKANINQNEYRLGKNMIFMKDSAYFTLRTKQKANVIETDSEANYSNDQNDSRNAANDNEDTSKYFDFKNKESPQTFKSLDALQGEGLVRRKPSFKVATTEYSYKERMGSAISLQSINNSLGLKVFNGLKDSRALRADHTTSQGDTDENAEHEWDRFEMFEEDPERDELQHSNLVVYLKGFLYILFFLIILASSVIQKLTLNQLAKLHLLERVADTKGNTAFTLLTIAICIPYGIALIFSIHKFAFSSEKRSPTSVIIMVLLPETFHSIGLCVFLFYISPKMDIFSNIVILNSVGIIPSLVSFLFIKNNKKETMTRILIKLKNFLIFIFQLGALIALLYFTDKLSSAEKLITCLCLVFVSINSWENFYDECTFSKQLKKSLFEIRKLLNRTNGFSNVIVYIWKILLTFLIGYLFTFQDYGSNFQILDEGKILFITPKLAIILLTSCTAVGYYISYQACRLRMQQFSFSASLCLSTPVSFAAYFALNELEGNLLKYDYSTYFTMEKIIAMGCGTVLYLTFQLIVSYIWYPTNIRLQQHDRLFHSPTYCSVFFEQTLLLDRKRRDNATQKVKSNDIENQTSTYSNRNDGENKSYPIIYACATMWHENENEMMQLLKSIFRMAMEQTLLTDVKNMTHDNSLQDEEYYDFEAHIFFDDAMVITEDEDIMLNTYVQKFLTVIDKAASSVRKEPTKIHAPCKIITPYGGQLLWQLQENVLLFVHLKDKKKIRNKKRWSQVMYMYYLLAHRLAGQVDEKLKDMLFTDWSEDDIKNLKRQELMKRAHNTYILALDGDVDFQPDAVEKLLDLMKNDVKLGAACGRIHPMGKGPLIWFQIFEYALGHWYQKATEHVLGCVLCSPGCFSLFRGSALMDKNVARKYAILPTEPQHHLQFDQGEDRWLCTLLLQQGYKIGYCAASDAYTFAPETFNEFFNQRRRWMPSTIVNILDLLGSYKLTIQKNDNVSVWFILYQLLLMILTIIGPSTVMMMIAVALDTVFQIGVPLSYLLVLIPNVCFVISCFYLKSEKQLMLASFQSAIYTFIMLAVIVGVIIQAVQTSILNPGVIIIVSMTFLVTFSGLLHMQEFYCLVSGIVYFICIPLAYLILVIYSMCNMHVVSWGTRETKQKAKPEENKSEVNKHSFASRITKMIGMSELSAMVKKLFNRNEKEEKMLTLLHEMNENIKSLSSDNSKEANEDIPTTSTMSKSKFYKSINKSVRFNDDDKSIEQKTPEKKEGSPDFWISHPSVGNGYIAKLSQAESDFWNQFISTYLYPLQFTPEEEQRGKENLLLFRTNCCFALILLNLMWMVINFMFQYRKPFLVTFEGPDEDIQVELFSFLFLLIFAIIFVIQFFGMILHRLETFYHIIACTNLFSEDSEHTETNSTSQFNWREIFRKLRYDESKIKSIKNSFNEEATRIINKSRKRSNVATLRETLRKRKLADVVYEGQHEKGITQLAMSAPRHLTNRTYGCTEESHL